MNFPHISDTDFPILQNVDVYKYQNVFDYNRWQGKVSIKLLNVLWNNDYKDVVYFENKTLRDEWFDSRQGETITLDTLFNKTPENSLKIPVPYNVAYKYNYLMVEMPLQTSETQPIEYEDSIRNIRRWYYFIDDMTQFAPNTTELHISVDYWMTFINIVNIPYLMLERGHAPMFKAKNVDTYLTNPLIYTDYLMTEDFNFNEHDTFISTSNFVPIGNGEKYVCFCAPYNVSDFELFDGTDYVGVSTPPTFSNTNERWGYQLQVNDYLWKYGNTDYSYAQLPVNNEIQDGTMLGCNCYAIKGTDAYQFFNYMAENHVNFLNGIQAVFVLDDSLFTISSSFQFHGYTLYKLSKKISNTPVLLTKEMFGFDEKYSEITKLYTFPYSKLEFTDDNGNTFDVKIEECGHIDMHIETSLMFPYLNINILFTNIGGQNGSYYEWKSIDSVQSTQKMMWASDFSKYMMNWNIPTYSIFVSSETAFAVENFAGIEAERQRAIIDYKNPVRLANTTAENAANTYSTITGNVNIETGKNVDNQTKINDTRVNMLDFKLENSFTNFKNANKIVINNTANANRVYQTKLKDESNTLTNALTDATNTFVSVSANITTMSDIGASLTTANIGSIASAGISGIAGQAMASVTAGKNSSEALATTTYNDNCNTAYGNYSTEIERIQTFKLNSDYNNQKLQMEYDNAAEILRDEYIVNANKVSSDTQASNTQATETANADYTRNAVVVAEQNILAQKQLEVESRYKNERLKKPQVYYNYNGDALPDIYERRGVRYNVRIQPYGSIARTGDLFLRFGYALNQVWNMLRGFNYGKHFTYWKTIDAWINDGSGTANIACTVIEKILEKGVTVWRKPEEIGMVSIYDNFEEAEYA